jgi:hypothetical protein
MQQALSARAGSHWRLSIWRVSFSGQPCGENKDKDYRILQMINNCIKKMRLEGRIFCAFRT